MTELSDNPFARLTIKNEPSLKFGRSGRFSEAGHHWRQEEVDALILAWAAQRPLLVRGEAGSGKSQVARAAAAVLGEAEPLVEVIHPRFEALDLLYRVDVVARLADAQIKARLDRTNKRYVIKGRLWEAIEALGDNKPTPVLLIDEIDKADADVPNALLDVLGNRSFAVPPLGNRVVKADSDRLPLVIITTNEERELPAAFVRRCVVLNLNPPTAEDRFVAWLVERGKVHAHLCIAEAAAWQAALQVFADRQATIQHNYPPVGLAEYIDLLTALHRLTCKEYESERPGKQLYWLERIGVYALVKNAGQPQTRPPRQKSAAAGDDVAGS